MGTTVCRKVHFTHFINSVNLWCDNKVDSDSTSSNCVCQLDQLYECMYVQYVCLPVCLSCMTNHCSWRYVHDVLKKDHLQRERQNAKEKLMKSVKVNCVLVKDVHSIVPANLQRCIQYISIWGAGKSIENYNVHWHFIIFVLYNNTVILLGIDILLHSTSLRLPSGSLWAYWLHGDGLSPLAKWG